MPTTPAQDQLAAYLAGQSALKTDAATLEADAAKTAADTATQTADTAAEASATTTFGATLQAGGPIFATDVNGAPQFNPDGSLDIWLADASGQPSRITASSGAPTPPPAPAGS